MILGRAERDSRREEDREKGGRQIYSLDNGQLKVQRRCRNPCAYQKESTVGTYQIILIVVAVVIIAVALIMKKMKS